VKIGKLFFELFISQDYNNNNNSGFSLIYFIYFIINWFIWKKSKKKLPENASPLANLALGWGLSIFFFFFLIYFKKNVTFVFKKNYISLFEYWSVLVLKKIIYFGLKKVKKEKKIRGGCLPFLGFLFWRMMESCLLI